MRKGIGFYVVVWLAWGCGSASADYRGEGVLQHQRGDGDSVDSEVTSLTGTFYLGMVPTDKVPLAEAGFLSRESYVRYAYVDDESELSVNTLLFGGQSADQKTQVDRHVGEFTYISKASDWFGRLRLGVVDGDAPNAGDIDGDLLHLAVGRYLTPTTAVQLFVERSQQDVDSAFSNDCDGGPRCFDLSISSQSQTEVHSVGLLARHVGRFPGSRFAVQALVQRADSDIDLVTVTQIENAFFDFPDQRGETKFSSDAWLGSFDFTWYPRSTLSLYAGLAVQEVESDTNVTYRLGSGWFVHPSIELQAQFAQTNFDGPQDDFNQFTLGVRGRL